MAYLVYYHYQYGNTANCQSGARWIPGTGGGDSNDPIRDQVSNAYNSLFGRYGEPSGLEGYVGEWVYGDGPAKYGTITEMVRRGGDTAFGGSGEWNDVQSIGRHTGQAPGSCPPLPSASFSASPSSIILGNSSTLFWSSSGVTSVFISPGIGGVSTSGSRTVSPSSTTTYTLTASGPRGTITRQTTVTVTIPPPPTVSFSALPNSIIRPATSTLSWTVTGNVSSVSINQGIGSVATSGSRSISPTTTTTYTITATGVGGTTTRPVTVTVSLPPPPDVSFSVSPTSIIRGGTSTLSWNVTGNVSSISIDQGIGSVSSSGSRSISPTSTTMYTITATGLGGTTTKTATLTVYIPPNVTFSSDSSAIIRNQCTTLRWTTTGDAGSATINQGIGAVNINGNRVVCPTETITYTINVSGLGGADSDSITLTVYQPPTVSIFTGPVSINYGGQGTLNYAATNTNISLTVTPTYNYRGSSVVGTVINLPTGASVNGLITTQIPYNNFGPFNVTYVIVATGNGGQESKQITIPINIDETPTNFLVPESEGLLKDQAPIYTPDAIATSYKIVIDDIDIPVEIKADKPILIDKNEQQDWERLRSI